MESLFKAAGINNNEERKERVTEYVDAEMDCEWRRLDSFSDGSTWEMFVNKVQDSYSEAISNTKSIAVLDRICREHARLGQYNEEEIHTLIRKFRAEAKKLKDVLSNRAKSLSSVLHQHFMSSSWHRHCRSIGTIMI